MSTSTAGKQQQEGGGGGGGGGEHGSIQAPPPTPSNHQLLPESLSTTTTELSLILNQLLKTPTLSLPLPSRRLRPLKPLLSPPSSPPPPPFISLLNPNQQTKQSLLSAASHHGFFHLTDLIHIPSHLPPSSLHEANSLLFSHTHHSPSNLSSLGFHHEEEDEDDPLLVLEPTSIDPNTLPALKEFTECLHRVAMDVLRMLFDMDPEIITPTPRCLIWIISPTSSEEDHEELEMEWRRRSKCYPYVMCMQYFETRGRARPSWIIGDSGELVPITPRADSLLVTLGDIAQVWSNGRFNKVRSIIPFHGCNGDESSISVSFMVTLPMESTISPLPLPLTIKDNGNNGDEDDDDDDDDGWKRFSPFLMEEYAWKVYHQRFTVKDPLISYRIQNA